MWRWIRRTGVDECGTIAKCTIEEAPDIGGIVLPVLVHRDDPVGAR